MTDEQLEELLLSSGYEKWVRGFNDYGNPVARLNYGGIYGTSGDGFKEELDLIMLAPSLARRVIAAEKLCEAALQVIDNYGFTSDGNDRYREVETGHINDLDTALTAYREASK